MADIYNTASNTLLSGTSGDDYISNSGYYATINAGAGSDTIENHGTQVSIDLGAGNDSIRNSGGYYATINAGAGSDTIENYGSNVTINAGAGNDSIYALWFSNVSINGGAGNDTIYTYSDGGKTLTGGTGSDIFIFYYDTDDSHGTDYITDYEEADTIQFNNVAVSKVSTTSAGNVIFKAGDNKLVVKNAADKVVTYIDADGTTKTFGGGEDSKLITLTEGDDTYSNTVDGATINALGGNDSIENYGAQVSIEGGAGNDSIYNYNSTGNADIAFDSAYEGAVVTLSGGAGDDYIYNHFYDYVSISGGTGSDTIYNYSGTSLTIAAGAGDDSIYNWDWKGNDSIDGGAGSDTITNLSDGGKTLTGGTGSDIFIFYYDTDDSYGTDTITDYEEADTIQFLNVAVSKVSTTSAGSVVFKAGDNKLVVKNAADKVVTYIDADGSTKTFGGEDSKLITLTDGNDTYSNSLDGATINALGGNDSIENYGAEVSINAGAGNDSIYNYTNTGDADIAFDSAYEGAVVTLSGGAGDDYIYNDFYDYVSISGGTGSDTIYNYNGTSLTIAAGAGNDSISNNDWKGNDSLNGGAGNDTIYTCSDGGKTLTGGTGSDIFIFYYDTDYSYGTDTITDYEEADTIQFLDVAVSKVSTNSSGSVIFKAGDNKLVVKNAADKVVTYIDADGTEKTFGGSSADEWKLDGTTATFGSLTVKGVTSLDGLSLSGKILTVSASSLGTEKISVSDGYMLALGDDVSSASTKKSWSLSKTTATYKQTTTAGYSLKDNEIIYSKKSSKTLATVKGVTSLDGLSVKKKIVTVSASSLGTEKISVSDGYTLALGDDVNAPATKKSWTLKNSTATYKQTTTAGYSLDDNEIIYSKKVSKTLATVKGVKSLDGLSVKGKVVTVSASSLGTEKISVSDGYTLALGDDVNAPATKKSWTLKNSTATYKQTTTAGYSLDDNEIIYSKKVSKTLATVKGAKSTDGLKVSGKTIKLSGGALSKKVTVSGAYTFDFASDYSKASITGSSSADTIIARGKNISISGGKGADIFALKPTVSNVISDYDSADKISLLSGAADFSVSGNDLLINGKVTLTGAADKSVTYIEGGAEKFYENASDDVTFNADGTGATLAVTYTDDTFNCADFTKYADTLITIDASAINYSLTITGNKRANRIVGGSEDDTLDGGAAADTLLGGNGNDSLVGGKGNDNLNGGNGNDELHGGEGNDKLTGSKGNDTLWGGVGDDTLSGGAGNDVFVYYKDDGNDTIVNYESDVDKIMVLNAVVNSPSVDKAGDVTFKIGSGQIVVEGASNQYIEIVDGVGNRLKVYTPPS